MYTMLQLMYTSCILEARYFDMCFRLFTSLIRQRNNNNNNNNNNKTVEVKIMSTFGHRISAFTLSFSGGRVMIPQITTPRSSSIGVLLIIKSEARKFFYSQLYLIHMTPNAGLISSVYMYTYKTQSVLN